MPQSSKSQWPDPQSTEGLPTRLKTPAEAGSAWDKIEEMLAKSAAERKASNQSLSKQSSSGSAVQLPTLSQDVQPKTRQAPEEQLKSNK